MKIEPQQLKAFLVDAEILNGKDFDKALTKAKEKKQRVRDILISEGLVSEKQLIQVEAYILGIPFINLENRKIDPKVLKIIPEPIAHKNNIVAFRKKGKELEVAMLDPQDLRTIDFIKKAAGLKVLPRLTTPEGIKNALRQYEKSLGVELEKLISSDAKKIETISAKQEKEGEDSAGVLAKKAKELPVIRIVELIMKHAILQRSSDIHIEPMEKEVVVRYRIDGVLHDARLLPKQIAPAIVARIKVLANLKLDEHRLPQDGRFKIETEAYRYSVRVSVIPVADGEKVVMRLLPETAEAFSLDQLGLRGKALEDVEFALRKPMGMVLVTGPTGSGKTTTLYSMLEILNTLRVNIATVEDPIEYRMKRINQTQVNPKIGLNFANALRSLLRQDPDIIMVGEIRDEETASLAINAALTGHMVLSTLHTNDAPGAVPRLIDMKAEPFLISSTVNIILAQRLVRKLCDNKEAYSLSAAQIKEIKKYCDPEKILDLLVQARAVKKRPKSLKDLTFYQPKESEDCSEGYKGRIGIFEVLRITESIKEMIVAKATADKIREQARKEGMVTMVEDGLIKAAQGITSIEEVLRVIVE